MGFALKLFAAEEAAVQTVLAMPKDAWFAFGHFLGRYAEATLTVAPRDKERTPEEERQRLMIAALRSGAERHFEQAYDP